MTHNGCCYGQDGAPKRLYATWLEAKANADSQQQKTGVGLRVYPCQFHAGFHLTKKHSKEFLIRGKNWVWES